LLNDQLGSNDTIWHLLTLPGLCIILNCMEIEVRANSIYTTQETLSLLKISKSTFLRLVKKGILSASKIGGQYRILGREILELFNPRVRQTAIKAYDKVSAKVKDRLKEVG